MSVKIMGLVWDLNNEEIDREEKYILLAYSDHADHKGFSIFPAIATIAEKTGYKERAVQLITRSLEGKGYLIEDGKGPHGTNKWRVPLDEGGVRIAPVNFTGVQNKANRGAKPKTKGVQHNAPEPSLPTNQPSLRDDEIKKIVESGNTKMDYILDQERLAYEAKSLGKSWSNRNNFEFNEKILLFADLCANRFGSPSKKEVSTWILEIGSWVDTQCKVADWSKAVEIVSKYSTPVMSPTGMTRAMKFCAQERRNGASPRPTDKRKPMPEFVNGRVVNV